MGTGMNYEEIPIQSFVAAKFQTPAVQKIVEQWRVEPVMIVEKVVEHFLDLGIYKVAASHERMLMKHMLQMLKTSPDIMKLVSKAKNEEARKQRNRHAE